MTIGGCFQRLCWVSLGMLLVVVCLLIYLIYLVSLFSINSTCSLHSAAEASMPRRYQIFLRSERLLRLLKMILAKESPRMETSDPTPNLHYRKQLFLSFHMADAIYVSDSITCSGVWCPHSCVGEASGAVTYVSFFHWEWYEVTVDLVRFGETGSLPPWQSSRGFDFRLLVHLLLYEPAHHFSVTKCELVDLLET